MDDVTLPLPGLSPLGRTSIVARFDGGSLSSDAGVLVLREVEKRLGVADRLAGCLDDPRNPDLIVHGLADMIRFRMLMIAAGYEDGNDAAALRLDPVFKMAQGTLPSGRDLASQPTLSRLENLPDPRALLRMGRAMVDLSCASFTTVPKRIVLDIDDTFSSVPHAPLMRCVSRRVADGTHLSVIKSWLTTPVIERDQRRHRCTTEVKDRHRGTPQGSPMSSPAPGPFM